MKRVGENCSACKRWRPSFAKKCSECGLPSPHHQIAYLAEFLAGERGARPASRVSARYHAPPKRAPRVEASLSTAKRYSVTMIRDRLAAGLKAYQVASELGVSPATVGRIQKRFLHGKSK